jgi:hypothetical protein
VVRQSLNEEADAVEHCRETTAGYAKGREQKSDAIPIELKIDRNSSGRLHDHSFGANSGSE